jgi:hypothetical protein
MERDLQAIIDITIQVASFQRYTLKLFQAYNLYNSIDTQLSRNQLIVSTDEELLINQKQLITRHPTWTPLSPFVARASLIFRDDSTSFRTPEGFLSGPGGRPPPGDDDPPPAPLSRWRSLLPSFNWAARAEEESAPAASSGGPPGPPGAPGAKAKAKAEPIPSPISPVPPTSTRTARNRPQPKKASPEVAVAPPLGGPSDDGPPPPPPAAAAAAAAADQPLPKGEWVQEAAHIASAVAAKSPEKTPDLSRQILQRRCCKALRKFWERERRM